MLTHAHINTMLISGIAMVLYLRWDPSWVSVNSFWKDVMGVDWSRFPDHYSPVFDFVKNPMNPTLAMVIYIFDVYFLLKAYYIEKKVVDRAHKKYEVHRRTAAVAMHGTGSVVELTVGLFAILYPENALLAKLAACLALFVNVPTGFILTPGVFGIKHLTVIGFAKFGILRTLEAIRVLTINHRLVPNLWILLQVGTVVRLLGFFILPYSSTDGRRGDLFTEPTNYTFNILLSGYLCAAFVYPPGWLLLSLSPYAIAYNFMAPRLSVKFRPKMEPTPKLLQSQEASTVDAKLQ